MKKIFILLYVFVLVSPVFSQEVQGIKSGQEETTAIYYFGENAKFDGKSITIKEWKEMATPLKDKFIEEYLVYNQISFDDKKGLLNIIDSYGGKQCQDQCLNAPLYLVINEYIKVTTSAKE